jgi:dihydrofolate synthase/folylpolyglutamate synthase
MKFPSWPSPIGYRNIDLGLDRVFKLLERLDNPHKKLPATIHIAGTNGKGSTLAFLKAIFEDANLKVHRYTSPHLVNFNERIILAGEEIEDNFLNNILQRCKKAAEIEPKINVTFFEGVTVAAFLAFSEIKADVLLLETGMGGRLDATNVIEKPITTIITPISLDHTEFLGNSLAKIAFEKAGIIKSGCPVIISQQKPEALRVLEEIAKKNGSEFIIADLFYSPAPSFVDKAICNNEQNYKINLIGDHQITNAKTAIAAALYQKKFKISPQNIKNGLENAVWRARLEKITWGKFFKLLPKNGQLILDGGHNQEGSIAINEWLKKTPQDKNYLICAMLVDKDSKAFLKNLAKSTQMLVSLQIKNEAKSKSAKDLASIAKDINIKSNTAKNFKQAIGQIIQYHNKNYQNQPFKIIICGSLYLAGWFLEEN